MSTPSLLRDAEHDVLCRITLSGTVLDLGGDKRSAYQSLCMGTYTVTTVNADPASRPDIVHDLERPLPIADASFDTVMMINVLEHIFQYHALLAESARVMKPGGNIITVVPFLFPTHPSPHDYWRFTEEALRKEFEMLHLEDVSILPLGGGVYAARYLFIDRLMPCALRFVSYYTLRYLVRLFDVAFAGVAHAIGKKYESSDYALGYIVTARKPITAR